MSTTPDPNRTTHTPGPWYIATESYSHATGVICVEHPEFDAIDVLIRHWPATFQEHNANACLIAAAPELLASLRALVQMYGPSGDYSHSAQSNWRRAEAAIAKAEGR